MPLYWNDLLSDNKIRVQSNEEFGAYVRLLGAAWHEDIPGTLPADDDVLARLAGAELSLWRKLSRRILPCFTLNEQSGRYEQKRMMAEHAKCLEQMEMKRSRAVAGAAKRWGEKPPESPPNAQAMLKHGSSNASQSQSQTLPLEEDKQTRGARRSDPMDDSEIPTKAEAIASAANLAIPADFAGMCYEMWKANGGCNGNGIVVPWSRQVNKRWVSNEGVQWRAGTHREQKTGSRNGNHNGHKPKMGYIPDA